MKTFLIFLVLSTVATVSFSQTDAGKVVLGLTPLSTSSNISTGNSDEIASVIQNQATKISGLKIVPRNNELLQQIFKEDTLQNDKTWLNSKVLAEVNSQLGATYLLTGKVLKIDMIKQKVKDQKVPLTNTTVPIYAKLVNIQISMSIINVSTGQIDSAETISSDMKPVTAIGGDSRTISKAIENLSDKYYSFIQGWYASKTGTAISSSNAKPKKKFL